MKQKRISPPFSLLAYGHDQRCHLVGVAGCQAEHVSIGTRRARVRLDVEAGSLLPQGEGADSGLALAVDGQAFGHLSCRVVWANGREAGVEFDASLGIGIWALQQAFEIGPQGRKGTA